MSIFEELIEVPDLPDAACKGLPNAEIFFPPVGRSNPAIAAQARSICLACPARQACFDWAMTHDVIGIWGGTTSKGRREASRALRLAAS